VTAIARHRIGPEHDVDALVLRCARVAEAFGTEGDPE